MYPCVQVFESIETATSIGDRLITGTPDGHLFLSVPMVSKVMCRMDVEDFPFDTQRCKFTMGSCAFDGYEVRIIVGTAAAVNSPC